MIYNEPLTNDIIAIKKATVHYQNTHLLFQKSYS